MIDPQLASSQYDISPVQQLSRCLLLLQEVTDSLTGRLRMFGDFSLDQQAEDILKHYLVVEASEEGRMMYHAMTIGI